jgi:DNA polymerase-3 subunit delta
MWHLFYGPDTLARDEAINEKKRQLGEGDAQLNITYYDSSAPITDIHAACSSLGFFVEKRIVVCKYWLSRADQPRRAKTKKDDDMSNHLVEWLPDLPETTDLIFVEDDALPESHPLIRLSKENKTNGIVVCFEMPSNVIEWINKRVVMRNARMSPQSAQLLANRIHRGNKFDRDHFAEDNRLYLRKLDNEIEKLTAYANGKVIAPNDVVELVAEEDVADMFGLMDAISQKRLADAHTQLRGVLMRGEAPQIVLTMIARQTRMLIMAKENESSPKLAELLRVKSFAAQKLVEQSRRFTITDLVKAHQSVLSADIAIKTGQLEDVVALDVLMAEIAGIAK